MLLARDRIGIKPLYYSTINSIFVFSSEIRSILSLPWVRAELNEAEFYHFLSFNFTSPPETLFKGIYKFHPGHKMVIDKSGINLYEPYWNLEVPGNNDLSEQRYIIKLRNEFEKSIKYRMVSDVPIGAFISGGVDSSAVVANMSSGSCKSINTFSVAFEDCEDFNELHYAREIANLFKTNHHELIVGPDDFNEFIYNIAEIFDDPLSDPTSIPIYFLTRLAKEKGVKVILTGDGPDELFLGYRKWLFLIKTTIMLSEL